MIPIKRHVKDEDNPTVPLSINVCLPSSAKQTNGPLSLLRCSICVAFSDVNAVVNGDDDIVGDDNIF